MTGAVDGGQGRVVEQSGIEWFELIPVGSEAIDAAAVCSRINRAAQHRDRRDLIQRETGPVVRECSLVIFDRIGNPYDSQPFHGKEDFGFRFIRSRPQGDVEDPVIHQRFGKRRIIFLIESEAMNGRAQQRISTGVVRIEIGTCYYIRGEKSDTNIPQFAQPAGEDMEFISVR